MAHRHSLHHSFTWKATLISLFLPSYRALIILTAKVKYAPHPLKFLYGIMIAQVTVSLRPSRGTLEVETQLHPT